ncbi:alpha/beta hydrolase [Streptomyces sp. ASQP_92]|uniref:alpha/beta fold hydrolase n=1 Tax=Streptomyces sp. ASQP_92 TaxID=2979116 RepID=UPI0021BE4517|nr:alpha/beta hydrolase [Streptomyces sp. ASQP_92]MCT9089929.1 alpha/beta hydrolase [Streptomyces sp. ASQP_92]
MARQFAVEAADTRLRGVDTLGSGPPVLFVNGGFSTRRQWKRVIGRLAGQYRTVTYDARGRGASGTSSDYSLRGAVDDVDRVIEATALRRPILVGWSHGATIALCYAAEYPESIGGLVLIDGAYPVSVLDAAGRERVRRRFRRHGWSMRIPAGPGRSVRMSARDCAEVVVETDEVNGDLAADWAALRRPTVLVVPARDTTGGTANTMTGNATGNRTGNPAGTAAVHAVASGEYVTLLATTVGNRARILSEDPDVVAMAIGEVRRRGRPPGARFVRNVAPVVPSSLLLRAEPVERRGVLNELIA